MKVTTINPTHLAVPRASHWGWRLAIFAPLPKSPGRQTVLTLSLLLNLELNLEDMSLGWSKKEQLYCFARQRGPQQANALKIKCLNLEVVVRSFYSKDSKRRVWSACGLSSDWLVMVSGSQHYQPSGSSQAGIYMLMGIIQLTSPNWWVSFQYLQNSSKILICIYTLRGNQDPDPRLHYCFLIALALSLHPLSPLIRSCLNLSFGMKGRSWRLNEAYFL